MADEITRERYPFAIPWSEKHAKPVPRKRRPGPPQWLVDRRRVDLCGTADLLVLEAGGDPRLLAHVGELRRAEAIRRVS